jgi:GxxExxY protein
MSERDPRTFAIIGAAMEVHRVLGFGFAESVYHDALAMEFTARGVPFVCTPQIEIRYKSEILKSRFIPDFICHADVIVELKALSALSGTEEAQVLNSLKATGLRVGLLLNFGTASLTHKRLVAHDSWIREDRHEPIGQLPPCWRGMQTRERGGRERTTCASTTNATSEPRSGFKTLCRTNPRFPLSRFSCRQPGSEMTSVITRLRASRRQLVTLVTLVHSGRWATCHTRSLRPSRLG